MTDLVVTYLCGCDAAEVGQAFHTGLMVCPQHQQVVAPFDRGHSLCFGEVTITLKLEAYDEHQGNLWVNALEETLLMDNKVTSVQTVEAWQ